MRVMRSMIFAGLALMAIAVTSVIPAVAATPADPGVYEAIKASVDQPAILNDHGDDACLACQTAALATEGAVNHRSPVPAQSLIIADTSIAVTAYLHIDPDIAG